MLPLVAKTEKTLLLPLPSKLKILTSKVPPPRSYMTVLRSPLLFTPKAKAAAVGSLIILNTFNPANSPATFVAER